MHDEFNSEVEGERTYVIESKAGRCLGYIFMQTDYEDQTEEEIVYLETCPKYQTKNSTRSLKYIGETLISFVIGSLDKTKTEAVIIKAYSKTGKPFYIIDFTDTTAKMSGLYFTRSNTLDKIRDICVGCDIIVRGKLSYYGEKKDLSLTIDKISLCKFPENFVPEELPLKDAPKVYSIISPEPAKTVKISNLFDEEEILPQSINRRRLCEY